MANIPISTLPAAASLAGADIVPVVQGGTTKKASLSLAPISTAAQNALNNKSDLPVGYLATMGVVSEFPTSTDLEPADENFFYNPSFLIWPHGYTSISIPADGDDITAGGWIGASHNGGPAATISRFDEFKGGITSVLSFTSASQFHYVRQLVPNVITFSKGIYTLIADVTVSGTVKMDAYIQARINANDLDREVVIDSPEITLTGSGRRYVAVAFQFPDLWDNTPTWDERSMLEAAWRFVSTASGTRTCTVHAVAFVPGRVAKKPAYSHPAIDRQKINAYYETGFSTFVGLNTTSGQKRCPTVYRTRKELGVVLGDITVKDLAGNVGKISTYDLAGSRTDNVAYTSINGDASATFSFQTGFAVVVNSSTAAGISYQWTVNNY